LIFFIGDGVFSLDETLRSGDVYIGDSRYYGY